VTCLARSLAASLLAATLVPAASAEIGSVTDLLPANSIFIMSAGSMKASADRIMEMPFMGFMKDEAIQQTIEEMMSDISGGLSEALGEDDVDPMTLLPSGAMGVSVFPSIVGAARTALPGLVIAGDYGDEADRMWQRLGTMMESDAMDDGPEISQEQVGGRTVWRMEMPEFVDEMNGGMDDMGGMGGMGGMLPDPAEVMGDAFRTMWVAREGRYIVLSSSAEAVRRMYDLADGVDVALLSERDDARMLMDRAGGRDMMAAVLMRDLPVMLSGVDQMGMLAVATPILQQYFGRITGMSAGITLDGENAMLEQRMFIAMPDGKAGFTALMDSAEATMDIPSFVPADALSYGQFTFEFDGVAPLIGRMARTAAMMGAPMGDPNAVQQMEQIVTQFTDTLGRRVHMLQTRGTTGEPGTGATLVAIQCPDIPGMDQFVSMFGPGMGFEGRDFAGQRIHTMDPGGMMMMAGMGGMAGESQPFAIGLGGAHAFMGMQPSVEAMLRSIGDTGGRSLGQSPRVLAAMKALGGGDLVGWGWSDTAATMIESFAAQKRQMDEMMEMMGGMDPAMQAEMMDQMGPLGSMMDMDPEKLAGMVGDSVWAMRSTADGFVIDSWIFAPAGE
jgi:hypothetical protein